MFAHAFAGEFDAIGVVNKAIENGIGDGRSDHVIPVIHGNLTCEDGGTLLVAILEDFQEIAALFVVELLRPPIIKNKQIRFGQALEQLRVTAVSAGKGERCEEARYTVVCGMPCGRARRPASSFRRRLVRS